MSVRELLVVLAVGAATGATGSACRRRSGATMTPSSDPPSEAELRQRRALAAEAREVLATIRLRQESYRAEFSQYCDVSSATHDGRSGATATTWPASPPGPRAVPWGRAPLEWTQLGVAPAHEVYFRYEVVAGEPGVAAPYGVSAGGHAWWVARAYGDLDGDGVRSTFTADSTSMPIRVQGDEAE